MTPPEPPRYAIYFSPKGTKLADFGARALGYDIHSARALPQLALKTLAPAPWAEVTRQARLYGFHATLKAPFRLAPGQTQSALEQAFLDFCNQHRPAPLPDMQVRLHHGFLAVTPAYQPPALEQLEQAILEGFEPFRAPLTTAEVDRRQPARLTDRQRSYLARFGYPYILEDFQFHMTLSQNISQAPWSDALREELNQHLVQRVPRNDLSLDTLALVVQPRPLEPFRSLRVQALRP